MQQDDWLSLVGCKELQFVSPIWQGNYGGSISSSTNFSTALAASKMEACFKSDQIDSKII